MNCQNKNRLSFFRTIFLLFVFASLPNPAAAQPIDQPHDVVDRFVQSVQQSDQYDAKLKQFIDRQWVERKSRGPWHTFIPEALAVLNQRFKTALDAFDAREYARSAKIMGELSLSPDPYLSTHAALFQAKALIQDTQLEYARMILTHALRSDFNPDAYCLLSDEMKFWQGYCHYHLFENDQAHTTLEQFLKQYPDASVEHRVLAKQMLKTLENPRPKDLVQVAELMTDAGDRLTEQLTGLETQTVQKQALLLLEEMVRNAQQQEQQSARQASSASPAGGMSNAPSAAPAGQSTVAPGSTTVGPLHAAPRANPAQTWGQMPPQQRQQVMQLLQQNFPQHYRDLIEQYYSELAKQE